MGLGNRSASRHDTLSVRKQSMDTTVFHDFKTGQRVMTVDGIAGLVTAVWDGPMPGNEEYEVKLDNGLGGGQYTASQLSSVGAPVMASDHHLASDDYPEMGTILHDRPPIERQATDKHLDEPADATSMTDPFAWADDDPRLEGPTDLSRQLPGSGLQGPAVQNPPVVDPNY
jgi:hypothetical protein